MSTSITTKTYYLLGADSQFYASATPGTMGGNRKEKLYGRLDCKSANDALPRGYAAIRVFFADEATAIAAGYRPCGKCMQAQYKVWKAGGAPGTPSYPWLATPKAA